MAAAPYRDSELLGGYAEENHKIIDHLDRLVTKKTHRWRMTKTFGRHIAAAATCPFSRTCDLHRGHPDMPRRVRGSF